MRATKANSTPDAALEALMERWRETVTKCSYDWLIGVNTDAGYHSIRTMGDTLQGCIYALQETIREAKR